MTQNLVRTKVRGVFKYVKLGENWEIFDFIDKGKNMWKNIGFEVSTITLSQLFLTIVLEVHQIERSDEILVDLFDNVSAPIPHGELFNLIKQYGHCACFSVELIISGEANKSITSEVRVQLCFVWKVVRILNILFSN